MKKIIISNYDDVKNPYYGGGGSVAIHEVAKRLCSELDVTVITGAYPGSRDEALEGVRYKRIGTGMFGPKIGQLVFWLLLPFYARTNEYDLWIESFTPPVSASLLPLFSKAPVIGLAHALGGADAGSRYGLPFELIERLGLRAYSRCIAVSDSVRQKIASANPRAEIAVVPNGVSLPPVGGQPGSGDRIAFLGRIDLRQKGLDLLLEAYSLFQEQIRLPLYIAGSGVPGEERKLKDTVRSRGLENSVHVLGKITGEEKNKLLNHASFTVVPSRSEAFCLSALESLAFGKPVIAFNIPGLQWLPAAASMKVEPFSPARFGESMAKLAGDRKLLKNMGGKGRMFASRYSWEKTAKQYKRIIMSTLANKLHTVPAKTGAGFRIQDILDRRTPCYFISPHLDDAMLSAGDLIIHLAGKTSVSVITVFTEAGTGPHSLSARRFMSMHGYRDAARMYGERRMEDRKIFSRLGVQAIHLGFTDALWRKKPGHSLLSRILPELGLLYPTYRFHAAAGVLHNQDAHLCEQIARKLKQIVPHGRRIVFCPAAFGGHVDHVAVRIACRQAFGDLVFWKDGAYKPKDRDKELVRNLNTLRWKANVRLKDELLQLYRSQIPRMFRDGIRPEETETFYYGKAEQQYT